MKHLANSVLRLVKELLWAVPVENTIFISVALVGHFLPFV